MKAKTTMTVSYAAAVYGKEEIRAVLDVLKNPTKIVAGPRVKEFEKRVAKLFGKKHGVMVNSGSSANLIALSVLRLPEGSEVITPALTFSTTLAPIIQKRLVPVFADVELGTYVVDPSHVASLVTKKTKALMIPSLIGNLPDFKKLRAIAKKHGLYMIEDSCDTVGSRFAGKPTGAYTDISTTSFYASHIMTAAGGGGMAMFHDPALSRRALVASNWGRESTLFGAYEKSEEIKKRFAGVLDGEPYDAKFLFTEIGYNFQPTELQGAFGLVQLSRLSDFARRRRQNFTALYRFFAPYEDFFILPKAHAKARVNWLAFPVCLKKDIGFTRFDITKFLEERGIQTRPIFTGNVLKQPAFRNVPHKRLRRGGYPVTDYIMKNGFLIGCHHGLTAKQLNYMKEIFEEFLEKYL